MGGDSSKEEEKKPEQNQNQRQGEIDRVNENDNGRNQEPMNKSKGNSGHVSPRINPNSARNKQNSALSNNNNQGRVSGPKDRNSSLTNKPSLPRNSQPNSSLSNQRPNRQSNQNIELYEEDDNQFMPLLKLGEKGQTKLKINMYQILMEGQGLLRNSAAYTATLQYLKDTSNSYRFNLKEEGGYGLNLRSDLQGNLIEEKTMGKNSGFVWNVLCPVNIPFGPTHKIGQYKCINIYEKLFNDNFQDEPEDDDDLETKGPSLKNIEIQPDEEIFYKWNEQPHRRREHDKQNKGNKKLVEYREISRYIDFKQNWVSSTFVEQTGQYYRAWIVQNLEGRETMGSEQGKLQKQLKRDLNKREREYIEYKYKQMKGVI